MPYSIPHSIKQFTQQSLALITAIFITLLVSALPASAAQLTNESFLATGSIATAIAVSGNYVYMADAAEVVVVDISDTSAPVIIDRISKGYTDDLVVDGNYMYVTDYDDLTSIYDITDPTDISLVSAAIPSSPDPIEVSGNYLYSIQGNQVWSYDITDPTSPVFEDFIATGSSIIGTAINGTSLLTVGLTAGLQIVDISDPANLTIDGSIDPGTPLVWDVATAGSYAYIANSNNGLVTIDISDPSAPTVEDTDPTTNARLVSQTGSTVFIGDRSDGIISFNISTADDPSELDTLAVTDTMSALTSNGNSVFAADSADGLLIVDAADTSDLSLLSSTDTTGYPRPIAFIDANTALVDDSYNGFTVLDLTDPLAPVVQDTFDISSASNDLIVDTANNVAYSATGSSGVRSFDISDLSNITQLDQFDPGGQSNSLVQDGDTLYMGNGSTGLYILDITDPSAISTIGFIDTTGSLIDIVKVGDTLYGADNTSGLLEFNVSDPANPSITSTDFVSGDSITRVVLDTENDQLFTTNSTNGITVFDISATTPSREATYGSLDGEAREIVLDGTTLFVIDADYGMKALDVSDVSTITESTSFADTRYDTNSFLSLYNNVLYVSNYGIRTLTYDGDDDGVSTYANDCDDTDGTISTNQTYYADNDGDNLGNSGDTTSVCQLTAPTGYVANSTDSNDDDFDNDGVSTALDCNPTDATAFTTYYQDSDGDGLGNSAVTQCAGSSAPTGYVTDNTDSNDTVDDTTPDEPETDITEDYPTSKWKYLTHQNEDYVVVIRKNGKKLKVLNTTTDTVQKSVTLNKKNQKFTKSKVGKLRGKNVLAVTTLKKKGKVLKTQLFRLNGKGVTRKSTAKVSNWSKTKFKVKVKKKKKQVVITNKKGKKNLQTYKVTKKFKLKQQ